MLSPLILRKDTIVCETPFTSFFVCEPMFWLLVSTWASPIYLIHLLFPHSFGHLHYLVSSSLHFLELFGTGDAFLFVCLFEKKFLNNTVWKTNYLKWKFIGWMNEWVSDDMQFRFRWRRVTFGWRGWWFYESFFLSIGLIPFLSRSKNNYYQLSHKIVSFQMTQIFSLVNQRSGTRMQEIDRIAQVHMSLRHSLKIQVNHDLHKLNVCQSFLLH